MNVIFLTVIYSCTKQKAPQLQGFEMIVKICDLDMVPRPDLKRTKNLLKSNILKISLLNYAPSYAPNFENLMARGLAGSLHIKAAHD